MSIVAVALGVIHYYFTPRKSYDTSPTGSPLYQPTNSRALHTPAKVSSPGTFNRLSFRAQSHHPPGLRVRYAFYPIDARRHNWLDVK